MNEAEVSQEIKRRLAVTNHAVVLAKAYLLGPQVPDEFRPNEVFTQYAVSRGLTTAQYNGDNLDSESQAREIAEHISAVLAACQAFWELVGVALIQYRGDAAIMHPKIPSRRRGYSGSLTGISNTVEWLVPGVARKSPIVKYGRIDPVVDGDLFLLGAGLLEASPEIQESAQDSVATLKAGLFRPAVVMLGKTSEGAWMEMGTALAEVLTGTASGGLKTDLSNHRLSTAGKIAAIAKQFRSNQGGRDVQKASGVSDDEFEHIMVWTNVVRDARNAVHPGGAPNPPNTYEKTAVLFLDAPDTLRKIYLIRRAALNLATP